MAEPIVSREVIVSSARIAANQGHDINVTNPYPAGTAAHALWELSFRLAADEGSG